MCLPSAQAEWTCGTCTPNPWSPQYAKVTEWAFFRLIRVLTAPAFYRGGSMDHSAAMAEVDPCKVSSCCAISSDRKARTESKVSLNPCVASLKP